MGHSDPALARFKSMIRQWELESFELARRLARAALIDSESARAPAWKLLRLAKHTNDPGDWVAAFGLLAQAALDHRRPAMVASVALSSVLAEGYRPPAAAYRALVDPIETERLSRSSGYDWDSAEFPLARSAQAWRIALEVREGRLDAASIDSTL